ncbi:NDR1/HIN1-like protein 10 [Hordeum vulgare subsp. vulgare]|uniref:Late embryogenesis abundant protein LEA-2 subgroup domain-containing protein n=1 Tax=Hordeum vulgare subsp. vulgare TaxID=112509 RepID=A0A8I6YG55_HORVV|nr:NDR1/HIN1-like protein 10 [Hordeum vulgare subsp. vulgare]
MGKASTVSSWLCCPCRCLFCGLLSCLFSVVATILVIAGVVVLALYLLFRPHLIHATAASADLGNFTLTPQTWILCYNLSVALSVRNPNSRIAIHYHSVEAEAYYMGQSFARADLPDFYQETGETTVLPLAFAGDHPLEGGVAAAGFRKEAIDHATFSVDVKLSAKMQLKVWAFRVPGPKPRVDCPLIIQRRNASEPTGASPPEFHPIECRVWF